MSAGGDSPELRASDAEREAVAARLRDAVEQGRLSYDELDERLGAVYGARTRGELEPLLRDLPAPADGSRPPDLHAPPNSDLVLGIMGSGHRKGTWRVALRTRVLNVMGGADLDLRRATLPGPVTEITVLSIMGGSTVTVPEGVRVELGGFGIMGGNELRVSGSSPPPGAPTIRIRAISIMGGTTVRSPRWRRGGLLGHWLPGPPPPSQLP